MLSRCFRNPLAGLDWLRERKGRGDEAIFGIFPTLNLMKSVKEQTALTFLGP